MENEYRQIVYNAVKCEVCQKTIASYHRHDYKTCGCPNDAMVDGGFDYQRYGARDMNKISTVLVYADEPYIKVRVHAVRMHREPDGSLKSISLAEMDLDWLKAAVIYEREHRPTSWHLKLLEKELEFRNETI